MATVKLGGDRLGSGNKQNIHLREYERSTHDLSYAWRSTMASGTLVPFMVEVGLRGDTFDIDLECDVKTHPTLGPLFGSYKIQLDVFVTPVRLYQGKLHMNMLNIGRDMSAIKLPQLRVYGRILNPDISPIDNQQINPSCILNYLGIRGIGSNSQPASATDYVRRDFNAIPFLIYWDTYKNYYANKQEEFGVVIHHPEITITAVIGTVEFYSTPTDPTGTIIPAEGAPDDNEFIIKENTRIVVNFTTYQEFDPNRITINLSVFGNVPLDRLYTNFIWDETTETLTANTPTEEFSGVDVLSHYYKFDTASREGEITEPILEQFPLDNIDEMRVQILQDTAIATAFTLTKDSISPYGLPLDHTFSGTGLEYVAAMGNQEGLAIKTYQSDIFNNWIDTEWISGENGINEITAIDTSGGSFTIDELNMSNKIYNMLNRIALSGGSYDDWQDVVYGEEGQRKTESPVYVGGLSKELIFQEIISSVQSADGQQPLGELAGKGRLSDKHKGGKVRIKVTEASYIMGIVSITPRIDYSQGNKWDVNLKTMNDFHKPALDEIGFQDLLTDQMAYWDTSVNPDTHAVTFKSAGKQPAWINYMTNYNQVKGNFADESQQMFMVLNRRYEAEQSGESGLISIKDLTTYIDPVKFNYIFADTRRDAQNYWVQIGVGIEARRKMSAKVMPNL